MFEILQGRGTEGVFGTGEMEALAVVEALGFGKELMKAHDFEAMKLGCFEKVFAIADIEQGGVVFGGNGEGGNLQAGVAQGGGRFALLHERAVLKGLVADGKLHGERSLLGACFAKSTKEV